jgi:transposase
MKRRNKVELFEQIRREYEFGVGTISGVAEKFNVHRRMVRDALRSAVPPQRKSPQRNSPKLDVVRDFIDQILEADEKAPRKQRHTAHRIFVRLGKEGPASDISERRIREYVQDWKLRHENNRAEVFVPQSYQLGIEAQVDWYEAMVEIAGMPMTVQIFNLRSMASGAAFHRAYLHATQQAFFDGHQRAFHYYGGVFRRCRYDNLGSAVKKIFQGREREQTDRFIAFRSHWQFEASFCSPGKGHEKGGVENEVGYFRRNHLVPVPRVGSLDQLNQKLLDDCRADLNRILDQRPQSVGEILAQESPLLRPLPKEDFDLAEEGFYRVNKKGCVSVRGNHYSTPQRPGTQVRVRVLPSEVEIHHQGRIVASHARNYGQHEQILELEHYLDVLAIKPGAFAGSRPLESWRLAGRWTAAHDQFWKRLEHRHGESAGTRLMIELLQLGKQYGYEKLTQALEETIELGVSDAAVTRYLLTSSQLSRQSAPLLEWAPGKSPEFHTRPLPSLSGYDQLLGLAIVSPKSEIIRSYEEGAR